MEGLGDVNIVGVGEVFQGAQAGFPPHIFGHLDKAAVKDSDGGRLASVQPLNILLYQLLPVQIRVQCSSTLIVDDGLPEREMGDLIPPLFSLAIKLEFRPLGHFRRTSPFVVHSRMSLKNFERVIYLPHPIMGVCAAVCIS